MITYLHHEQIDRTRWDRCIAESVNGLVYAWSWYLDSVHPGWEALVEVDSDNYLKVMPITSNTKYGIPYLHQPFFAQQLGIFSTQKITEETTMAFMRAIPSRYALVEIRLNEANPFPKERKEVLYHHNYLLDLNYDYNLLYSNYHQNTKRNLKKSLNYGLKLRKQVPVQSVIELFRRDRGASIHHWGDAEYARFAGLTERAITSSNAFVYGIETIDNELICAAVFMQSHQRITFLFSGNSAKGKECAAMAFLIDQVVREFAAQPFLLDFEGSDDSDLARFYAGFGAYCVDYPSYTIPLQAGLLRRLGLACKK